MKGFSIPAEVHSDDWAWSAEFDAAPWMATVDEDDILELAACGWGGDYPADAVARESQEDSPDVAAVLDYVTDTSQMGFECHVNEQKAMEWLQHNRPAVFLKLTQIAEGTS